MENGEWRPRGILRRDTPEEVKTKSQPSLSNLAAVTAFGGQGWDFIEVGMTKVMDARTLAPTSMRDPGLP
jgi:hypothetical protein